MKKFKVPFWYTEYGTMIVEAESAKEAEEKMVETLDSNGLEDLDYKCHDRDYGTSFCEEVDTEK